MIEYQWGIESKETHNVIPLINESEARRLSIAGHGALFRRELGQWEPVTEETNEGESK